MTALNEPLLADTTPSPGLPSRFTATPAEVDAYLRTILAEDTYLRYQRAIGDAVLDEIQTSGKAFRAGQEAEHAKHVYLAGMDDVLQAIWDDRYYPSQLLCSKHNGFGPCKGAPWCTPSQTEAGDPR